MQEEAESSRATSGELIAFAHSGAMYPSAVHALETIKGQILASISIDTPLAFIYAFMLSRHRFLPDERENVCSLARMSATRVSSVGQYLPVTLLP